MDQIIVLSFCDGEQMAQQDELAAIASSSGGAGVNGSAGETKTSKIKEEEEDDDDDIFGDKEIEQEEEAEAKKEEVEDMSTRVKAKGKGVYFVELNSTVNVKRMRTIVSAPDAWLWTPRTDKAFRTLVIVAERSKLSTGRGQLGRPHLGLPTPYGKTTTATGRSRQIPRARVATRRVARRNARSGSGRGSDGGYGQVMISPCTQTKHMHFDIA